MNAHGPAWVEIDLDALGHNVSLLKRVGGGALLAAVVKANGYGLGALPVAEAAIAAGAQRVCVFHLDEAEALREQGFAAPILILGPFPAAEAERAVRLRVAVTLTQPDVGAALARAGAAAGAATPVHLNVDVGMQRLGVRAEVACTLADAVRAAPSLQLEGLYTHLPNADEPEAGDSEQQFARFLRVAEQVGAPLRHVANTAALLRFPAMALEMTRPGIGLFGVAPAAVAAELRPVVAWRATVVQVREAPAGATVSYGGSWRAARDSRLGVLAVGYADGFRRALSNRAAVLVRGRRVPVVGRVCMDVCLVDLTDVPGSRVDDIATIVGTDGAARITLEELAGWCETIPYEVCSGLGERLTRLYLRGGRAVAIKRLLDRAPLPTGDGEPALAALRR